MYLIARRTWCPFRQWKSKVSGWHSSMERYLLKNIIFKDAFSHGFRVGNWYQVAGWSIGDHVNWHIASITLEVYQWGPTRCGSDDDRDAWIQEEHEGTCLRCTEGKYYKGTIPLMQQVHRFGTTQGVWESWSRNLMYTGGRKPSMAWRKAPRA